MASATASKKPSQEEVVAGVNRLRAEQKSIANKLSELQMDLNEHRLVIETLDGVDSDRKCFRMIGGVLVERTVKEVAPALRANKEKMGKLIETLDQQLVEKGKEINDYAQKHNIQFQGATKKEDVDGARDSDKKAAGQGVLVSSHQGGGDKA